MYPQSGEAYETLAEQNLGSALLTVVKDEMNLERVVQQLLMSCNLEEVKAHFATKIASGGLFGLEED